MSAVESNLNVGEGDTPVGLSVQGQYFIVRKSVIESHDWILSKILSSDISWEMTSDNGQIYLDVDPTSFRIILSILNGTFNISQDAKMLPRSDFALLKSTARYLMLDNVYENLCQIETGFVAEYNAMRLKKDKEIFEIEEQNRELRRKTGVLDRIQAKLETLDVQVVQCCAYKTHRPFNQCGAVSITIGFIDPSDKNGPCLFCDNNCSRLRSAESQMATRSYTDNIDDFADALDGVTTSMITYR